MLKGILTALFRLILVPFPETKDLITIVSINIFDKDVIQGQTSLIDNIPLHNFVIILAVIYGFTFILKLANAYSSSGSSSSWYHWFPFVAEIEIELRTIQETYKKYKTKLMMEETINKLTEDTSEEEWVNIFEMVQAVEQAEMKIETFGQKKKQIKMVSCLADVLQGCVLMVLLLRTDLRVRSVLKLASISQRMGFDARKEGVSGDVFELSV